MDPVVIELKKQIMVISSVMFVQLKITPVAFIVMFTDRRWSAITELDAKQYGRATSMFGNED